MKNKIVNISKIVLSIGMIPLWFLDMFKGIGHLPNQKTGEIVEVVFWHTMFENTHHPMLAYFSMTALLASAVLNVVVFKYPQIQKLCNIVFVISVGVFLILYLFAASVNRGY